MMRFEVLFFLLARTVAISVMNRIMLSMNLTIISHEKSCRFEYCKQLKLFFGLSYVDGA